MRVTSDAAAKEARERPAHALPRWVALAFFVICLALVPQIVHLSGSLARVALANHWRAVWVGLDIGEAITFLLTAWLLFLGSPYVAMTASMAAAIVWVDAWFDVLTSFGRHQILNATNLAVFVEVPLGVFCLFVASREVRALCSVAALALGTTRSKATA